MMQKTQISQQLKRSVQNVNPIQQGIDMETNIQQLINRIQETIVQTSQQIKGQLQAFEYQQLMNYKEDLFKIQDEFIKVRAQRNQDVIKNKIMQQKNRVEQKFNIEMKKSMDMNGKYENMKGQVKKMNQEERELILQINYIKKKIQKQKLQSIRLDEQIEQMKSKKSTKKLSRLDQQRRLFTELVNKCDNNNVNIKNINKRNNQNNEQISKPSSGQGYKKKMQKKLKQQISNLKDYIENIPLQLNFIQNKLLQAIKSKLTKPNTTTKTSSIQQTQYLKQEQNQHQEQKTKNNKLNDNENENKQNYSNEKRLQQQANKQNKCVKLPNINHEQNKINKSKNISSKMLRNPNKQMKSQQIKQQQNRNKQQICYKAIQNKKRQAIKEVPRSSFMLQQILQDPNVKQYLYKLLFE